MKNVFFAFVWMLLTSSFLACGEPISRELPAETEQQPITTELLINLTSDPMTDPHSGLMGLHLGQKALKGGKEVTVFLNVHGVKLLASEAASIAFHGENLREVMTQLMQDGGVVRACPHCMEVHELTAEDLPEGVRMMEDGLMMDKLNANLAVFTY